MYNTINNDKSFDRVEIRKHMIHYTAFADDATFLINGNKSSFESLILLIDKNSAISGLKLNEN